FTPLKELLIEAILAPVKVGITAGIGLVIAVWGLRSSGLVVLNPETFVALRDVTSHVTLLAIVGLFLTLVLVARNMKCALFIGMFVTAIIGYVFDMLHTDGIVDTPPAMVFFDLDIAGVFSHSLYTVVFAFLLVTIFDTTGTMI